MAYLSTSLHNPMNFYPNLDKLFQFRWGRREIRICKDYRKHLYPTHPILECRAGARNGHLEVLLLRSWLIVFTKAQG
jgi:hypothetical protein